MLKYLTLFIIIATGCVKSQVTSVKFADYGLYTGDNPGNKGFEELGPVKGSAVSWSFAGCERLVVKAITEMVENAKMLGANTVFNVRFGQAGTKTLQETIPFCKRRFGLMLFMVPMWADVRVNGVAAKVTSASAELGTFHFQPNDAAENVALDIFNESIIRGNAR